jgi:SAM-dependent methyltransferase
MNQPARAMHMFKPSIRDLARCRVCAQPLGGNDRCLACGRLYPVCDGILEAVGTLTGRNRIVANFYDGPGWRRFRLWEQAFLIAQGGIRRARMEILSHVVESTHPEAVVLEVGIGRGENLRLLPPGWSAYGVDIARTQLQECRRRHPLMSGRLAWAEAENLPFDDATFDACWTIGGFNYFTDHGKALREMRRVTRPGGPIVVADERPSLHRAGLGHLLGVPSFDAWWLRMLGLDREFVEMVLAFDIDLTTLFDRVWPGATHDRIWHGLGYCVVDLATPF